MMIVGGEGAGAILGSFYWLCSVVTTQERDHLLLSCSEKGKGKKEMERGEE